MLLAAAAVVFVIACSNVANLILARSVRREGELAVRAALGASRGALRRTLLAESLVLCGAGAVLGVLLARPLVAVVARFAARFSVRALDVTVDASLLWVGAGLAMAAAVLLAYVPRLPSPHAPTGLGLASGSVRITPGTNRRLRVFATTQIALLVRAARRRGHAARRAGRAADAPTPATTCGRCWPSTSRCRHRAFGRARRSTSTRKRRAASRQLPGVERVALGNFVPWRDAGTFGSGVPFTVEGYTPADGEENPHARLRIVAPGFFAVARRPAPRRPRLHRRRPRRRASRS